MNPPAVRFTARDDELPKKTSSLFVMNRVLILTAVIFLTTSDSLGADQAGRYTFRNLYDSSDGLGTIFQVAMNDFGVVAFHARRDSTISILMGDGGPLTTVAEIGGAFDGTTITGLDQIPTINNSGTVVFKAELRTEVHGIYAYQDGEFTVIADTSGPLRPNLVNDFGVPDINNEGIVLFQAGFDAGGSGTFISDGVTLTQVLPYSTSGFPSINDAGVIAYSISDHVFTKDGDTVTNLTEDSPPFSSIRSPNINNAGTVAFGYFRPAESGSVRGVAEVDANGVNIIAEGVGGFARLDFPGINDKGEVAFDGILNGRWGIFTGPDIQNDCVIIEGDALFDSTVVDLAYTFFRHGFNNKGQIAFSYELANGISGVAIATPIPEPSTFALALIALCLVARRHR